MNINELRFKYGGGGWLLVISLKTEIMYTVTLAISFLSKGPFINDVTQRGGGGETLGHRAKGVTWVGVLKIFKLACRHL